MKKKLLISSLVVVSVAAITFLAACGKKYKPDPAKVDKYTYNLATNSLATAWNTHTYQSNTATLVLDYTEDGLYTFDYNENKDGYKIVTAMAKEMPIDVTSDYVGSKWGIEEGETGKAYKIILKDNLKFDNGKAIHAADFVESAKLLLNPDAANYRADSMYTSSMKIKNSESYFKGGKYGYSEFVSASYGDDEYIAPEEFTLSEDGIYQVEKDGKIWDVVICIENGGNWDPDNGLSAYAEYGYLSEYELDENGAIILYDAEGVAQFLLTYDEEENEVYTKMDGTPATEEDAAECEPKEQYVEAYAKLVEAADKEGYVKINEELLTAIQDVIAIMHGYGTADEYAEDDAGDYAYIEFEEMAFLGRVFEKVEWDTVGYFADPEDQNALIIILEKSLSGFYLNYSLCSSMFLVDTELYKSCEKTEQGVYSNTYGTSVDTYTGFGPYKLTYYLDGNEIKFEKNEYWYGYTEEENKGLYQTTNISIKQVSEEKDRLNMFLAGELDSYGLQAQDMDDYQSSKYCYYTEGDSTWLIAFNPSVTKLAEAQKTATPVNAGYAVNKTVIAVKEFRMALSFALDRAAYELALDPTGSVAKAIYGNMIISDPDTGEAYRTTEKAKDVILKFWGLDKDVANGKFSSKDEAIASITGYDPAGAKTLFNTAYEKAVEEGLITADQVSSGKWEVQIMVGQPGSGSSTYYNKGYEFLSKAWTEAVKGTSFEGHLTFKQSQPLGSTSFANYLQNNQIDLLFGVGWTGSALDPYSLMDAYVNPTYQYDSNWDTTKVTLDIELDGKTLRASLYDWGEDALNGNPIEASVIVNGEPNGETVTVDAGTTAPYETRLTILAACEGAILNEYNMIPVGTDASASLKGMQIKFGTEEYVFGVGRGGIKYMTYHYDDADWEVLVKKAKNNLDYKVSE